MSILIITLKKRIVVNHLVLYLSLNVTNQLMSNTLCPFIQRTQIGAQLSLQKPYILQRAREFVKVFFSQTEELVYSECGNLLQSRFINGSVVVPGVNVVLSDDSSWSDLRICLQFVVPVHSESSASGSGRQLSLNRLWATQK
ncbi:Hypothetical_protein [Hexamita inflata]|uniref:Hypothetical_protein n=1 Tax=Hexamita inflata TaxID=28002 RepID=A0ABP1HE19_9EUKA